LAFGHGKTVVFPRRHIQGNVPAIRNSKVIDIVTELRSFGVEVFIADPLANAAAARTWYHAHSVFRSPPADAVILAVCHDQYRQGGWTLVNGRLKSAGGLVMDFKAILDRTSTPPNVRRWRM
jgi:UDP-N-acetyl-D-galactosamine dehydrogenase